MMKLSYGICLLIFIFCCHLSSAQITDSVIKKNRIIGYTPLEFSIVGMYADQIGNGFNHEAGFLGGGTVSSTVVTLPFSLALLGNGFIDDEKKKQVSDRLLNKNTFEFNYHVNAYMSWVQDSFLFHAKTFYSFDISTGDFTAARFTDAVFNTIFYGNSFYAGKTADFSGTKFYSYAYDRFGFTVQKKIGGLQSGWEAGARLSLLNIRNAIKLEMPTANLFTEEHGAYIDATYNFNFIESDSSNHGAFQSDGAGGSVDLKLSWLSHSQASQITLTVNDLGAAIWNKDSRVFSSDSSIHFEGLQVNHLLTADTSTSIIQYNIDSLLKSTGTKETQGSRTLALPIRISLIYSHLVSDKVLLTAGASYCAQSDLLPLIFMRPQWTLSRSLQIAVPFSAGGSALYAIGFDALITIKNQFRIIAGSSNILGLISPRHTTSASLFLQAALQF